MSAAAVTDPRAAQRDRAISKANEVRAGIADVKRRLAAGELTLRDALADPRAGAAPVRALLLAQPRWGEQRCTRLALALARRHVLTTLDRRVRDLTARQRTALVDQAEWIAGRGDDATAGAGVDLLELLRARGGRAPARELAKASPLPVNSNEIAARLRRLAAAGRVGLERRPGSRDAGVWHVIPDTGGGA